jgi:hypothetical protein
VHGGYVCKHTHHVAERAILWHAARPARRRGADSVEMMWRSDDGRHLQLHPDAAPPALRASLALGRD